MEPFLLFSIVGGVFFWLKSSSKKADENKADEQIGTPIYTDVLAMKKALNPSGIDWLQWIDEPVSKEIRTILRKHTKAKFKPFADLYALKWADNLQARLTKKIYSSENDYNWILAIVEGRETVEQTAKDSPNVPGGIVPTGKDNKGLAVTMKVDTFMYRSVDVTKPAAEQKPDLVNMTKRTQYKKGEKTQTFHTTGIYWKDGIVNGKIYIQLANPEKTAFGWLLVDHISYNFK